MRKYFLQLRTGLMFYSHNEFIFNEEGDLEPTENVYDTQDGQEILNLQLNRKDVVATWYEEKRYNVI